MGDKESLQEMALVHNMHYEHHSVQVDSEIAFDSSLFSAAFAIENMCNNNHTVAIHSVSSMTRAPTLAALWVSLFARSREYSDINSITRHLDWPSTIINMAAIERIVSRHKHVQERSASERRKTEKKRSFSPKKNINKSPASRNRDAAFQAASGIKAN